MNTVLNTNTATANISEIVEYTGKNKPLAGHTLVSYSFKKVKADSALNTMGFPVDYKPLSVCASVPSIASSEIEANISAFMPVIASLIHDTRREILRDVAIPSLLAIATGKSSYVESDMTINHADIDIQAVIKYLAENSSSDGRLSKDTVDAWFTDYAEPVLAVSISAKLGITAQTPESDFKFQQLENTLNAVNEGIQAFIFSKKTPDNTVVTKMEMIYNKLVTSSVETSHEVMQAFSAKIEKSKAKPAVDFMDYL